MISFIKGYVAETTENSVILETDSIGYEIFMTGTAIEETSRMQDKIKIYTYFHVREDTMQLYGFLSRDDLEMFRLLLNVNGIGPKAAMGVLAAITADELRFAVLSDDVKTISRAPGIGKKTAQRLVLELKDKVEETELTGTSVSPRVAQQGPEAEAIAALVSLGYGASEAAQAISKVAGQTEKADEMIFLALKSLG